MSHRRKNRSVFVRVEDCRERHDVLMKSVGKVENALYGPNGRGGIAKDITEMKNKLDNALHEKELRLKWRLAIATSIVGVLGLIIVEAIKLLASLAT